MKPTQLSPLQRLRRAAPWAPWLLVGVLGLLVGLWLRGPASPASAPGGAPAQAGPAGAVASTTQAAAEADAAPVYTCSMHPQIERDGPGQCPLCGMDLVVRRASAGGGDPTRFSLTPEAARLARVETAPVTRRRASRRLSLVGEVAYDETRLADITAWLPGRIDRMFVDFRGMRIRKGDHLYRLYSPELVSSQGELQQAVRAVARLTDASPAVRESAERTLDAVRSKLRRWGLNPRQIADLEASKGITDQLTLYAPQGGVVIERAQVEGTWVETGTRLYRIAELDHVWVEAWAYEHQLPWLAFGQPATFTVDALPGQRFEGRVAFIDPYLDRGLRATKVRLAVPNPAGHLKPGMFARVQIHSDTAHDGQHMVPELADQFVCPMHPHAGSPEPGTCSVCGMRTVRATDLGYAVPDPDADLPLVVPATAPLLTGRRAVVYVAETGADGEVVYAARTVTLGPRTDGLDPAGAGAAGAHPDDPDAGAGYLVLDGLHEGEMVVVSGAFKLDAELQIRGGASMMNPLAEPAEAAEAPAEHGHPGDHAHPAGHADHGDHAHPAGHADHGDHPRPDGHAEHRDHAQPAAPPPKTSTAPPPAPRAPAPEVPAPRAPTTRAPAPMASATAPTAAPTPAPASVATAAPPSASTSAAPAPKVAAAEAAPLAATVAAYLHLQARLAADDDAGAAAGWQRLKQQLGAAPFDHPALKPHATALKDALRGRPATLADHRRGFQRVGKALIPTLKASPAAGGAPLTVFFCPMAFENTGAEWLQPAGSRLANPYFGAGMLRCGSARGQIQP